MGVSRFWILLIIGGIFIIRVIRGCSAISHEVSVPLERPNLNEQKRHRNPFQQYLKATTDYNSYVPRTRYCETMGRFFDVIAGYQSDGSCNIGCC